MFCDIGNVIGLLMGVVILVNYGFRVVFFVIVGVVLFNVVYLWNSLCCCWIFQVLNWFFVFYICKSGELVIFFFEILLI